MTWQTILRKDVIPHTTFISGAKPKGALDLTGLENFAMKLLSGRIRMIKETPDRLTGYIRPYIKEIVIPRATKMMEENPDVTPENAKELWKKAIKEAYSMKEAMKYALKRNVDSALDR
jgi:hypothetical protein